MRPDLGILRVLSRLVLAISILGCFAGPAVRHARAQSPPLVLEAVESRPESPAIDRVVLRNLPLKPGDTVTPDDLLLARERLKSTGYFDRLELYTARGSEPGKVILVVEGELDRSAHLETGFGYQPLDGWYLNLVGVRWNSPLRQGGFVRVGGRLGLRTSGIYADWVRPGDPGLEPDLLMRFRGGNQRWIAWVDDVLYRQDIGRTWLEMGLGWGSTPRRSATLWLGFGSAEPDTVLQEFNGDRTIGLDGNLPLLGEQQSLVRAQLDLAADGRDDALAPRRGTYLGGRARYGLVDGSDGFLYLRADVRGYVPLSDGSTLAMRANSAWVSEGAPYYERLIFGGIDNVRGFPDASLSGPLGARAFWYGSAELRRPLVGRGTPDPRVEGTLYLDFGQHWDAAGQRQELSAGVGYGLRVRVPWVQRFGLDVSIPLTESPTGDPFWIHFTLGFAY